MRGERRLVGRVRDARQDQRDRDQRDDHAQVGARPGQAVVLRVVLEAADDQREPDDAVEHDHRHREHRVPPDGRRAAAEHHRADQHDLDGDDAEGEDQRAVRLAEHLREVVGGDDHAERAPQDHAQDPDEQQRRRAGRAEVGLRQQRVAEEHEGDDGEPARGEVLHRGQLEEVPGDDSRPRTAGLGLLAGAARRPSCRPTARAAIRSSRCAATMQTSSGSRPSASTLVAVDPRVGLVGAGDLGAEDRVPGQLGVLGEVDGLGDVAVGAGRDDVGRLELGQAFDDVRPGVEAVPGLGELGALRLGEGQLHVLQDLVEPDPVQHVEVHPRAACRCARSPVAAGIGAPRVGESPGAARSAPPRG